MKKVLILEDEVSIRSFVVINLKRAGYEVVEAGTGEEALESAEGQSRCRRRDPRYYAARHRRL